MRFVTLGLLAGLGLAACTANGQLTPAAQTDLTTGLTDAKLALAFYAATPLPAANVIATGNQLLTIAQNAYNTYELNKNDAAAQAAAAVAISALSAYLLTSAPGQPGLTSTVPTA